MSLDREEHEGKPRDEDEGVWDSKSCMQGLEGESVRSCELVAQCQKLLICCQVCAVHTRRGGIL